MVTRKTFRCPDKIDKDIKEDAKRRGITSENEYMIDALKHYLTCTKLDTMGAMKLIPLKFPDNCIKCGSNLDRGEWAYWGRGVGVICLDCMAQRFGDKASVKKYLKTLELQHIRKSLEKECEQLAEEYRTYNLYERMEEMFQSDNEIRELMRKFLTQDFGDTTKEKEVLAKLEKKFKESDKIIIKVREFLQVPIKKKKKKKKVIQ